MVEQTITDYEGELLSDTSLPEKLNAFNARKTFHKNYQDAYSEHERINWKVSSLAFSTSLTESVMPTCLKQTTIVPVPNNAKVACLNDYHPMAHICSHETL